MDKAVQRTKYYCPRCYFSTEWPDKHWQRCLNLTKEKIRILKKEQRREIYENYLPHRVVPLQALKLYAESSNISVTVVTKVSK